MLFKSRAAKERAKVLKQIRLPGDLQMTATVGPKGSYREEHVMDYLRRWLDEWTPEREAAGDWRILYMDCYRAHLSPELADFCWSRGYVLLFHYGCTTGIAQVNDTDLHQPLSSLYVGFETNSFIEQQAVDPADISRPVQQVPGGRGGDRAAARKALRT